ncbi:MAG: hypothetical protein AAB559_01160 [Patescibacteria group bacterium]
MSEIKYDRIFGRGRTFGDDPNFFNKSIQQKVIEIGWSHACPVVSDVVRDFGPEWTLRRYAECNFVFGIILEIARENNLELYSQLIQPVPRLEKEEPRKDLDRQFIPANFYIQMSPLSTPWGYALPRIAIEQMGRENNNKDRSQEKILKAVDTISRAVKKSRTPIDLLINLGEMIIEDQSVNSKAVLAHILSQSILIEEGCKTIFRQIKDKIDLKNSNLKRTYESMTPSEREKEDIVNF